MQTSPYAGEEAAEVRRIHAAMKLTEEMANAPGITPEAKARAIGGIVEARVDTDISAYRIDRQTKAEEHEIEMDRLQVIYEAEQEEKRRQEEEDRDKPLPVPIIPLGEIVEDEMADAETFIRRV